jgi:transposase
VLLYYNPSQWRWANEIVIGSRRSVATPDLLTAASHRFYRRLNKLLRDHGFDDFVESQCSGFMPRRWVARVCDRDLLPTAVGRRLRRDRSERGICSRAADSLALRDFLGVGLDQPLPDQSTISRTRRLIALETHWAVFTWILQSQYGWLS